MSSAGPSTEPQIISVHNPTSSYAIIHSLQQEDFPSLLAKLSKKEGKNISSSGVEGSGWIKYEWNEGIWNLDDESDYSIFVWRFTSSPNSPTLHIRDPSQALPETTDPYANSSYYFLRPPPVPPKPRTKAKSVRSMPGSSRSKKRRDEEEEVGDGIPKHKKEFEKFHSENGVRTVMGSVGPVQNVRMLLKSGYRHVYISRTFAALHGFIPKDAKPGHYGYGGIVHIGQFPIKVGNTTTTHSLYLSEETHFNVILGRAFIERRGVQLDSTDMTNVVCRDTGEKLEVEVVVLRDGRGEVVTVT